MSIMELYNQPENYILLPTRCIINCLFITLNERAEEESNIYNRWHQENQYLGFLAVGPLVNFVKTFAEFPPRQKPQSFGADQFTELIWNLQHMAMD